MGSTANIFKKTLPIPKTFKQALNPLRDIQNSFKVLGIIGEEMTKSAEAPPVADVIAMPDPLQQEEARRRSIVEQLSRRGRQGTIMTTRGGGDRLGS